MLLSMSDNIHNSQGLTVQEINLYRLMQYYAKNWLLIALLTIIGLAAGFGYSNYIQTPLYKSDATLILIDPSDTSKTTSDTTLINNYIELMQSRRVLEPVLTELRLDTRYEDLAKSIEAASEKETEVIKISVSHQDPKTASSIADTTIMSFKREVERLYDKDNIQVVDHANLADEPYNVRTIMQLALGGAAGFFSAILLLFFVYDFKMTKRQLEAEARRIKPLSATDLHQEAKKPSSGRRAMRSIAGLVVGDSKQKHR